MAGAVVGAVTEFVTQKFIEKRDKIDVKAILYEGVVGGVTSVIGGVGGAAKKAGKTAKTAKAVVKTTAKAGAKEATLAFAEDLGRQVFVDGKSLKEVDYGQSLEAGASAGVTAVIDELDSVLGTKKQLSTTNRKKASQATGVIDDAADAAPRKRANALPDAEGMPNRGAVKNAAGGLADAGSGAGSAGRKNSPSLSKNQNKIQSQVANSTLSNPPQKTSNLITENTILLTGDEWEEYFKKQYGEKNVKRFSLRDMMSPEEAERYDNYWKQGVGSYENFIIDGKKTERIMGRHNKINTRQRLQVPPETRSIIDVKYSDGKDDYMYYRETIFDDFGRYIGNNDYTNHNRPDIKGHTSIHHHYNDSTTQNVVHSSPIPGLHPYTPTRY